MAGKQPSILCLDDQPMNLRIRKMLLEQSGCEVVTVTNAQECIVAATSGSFDLALLDYHLNEETTGEDVAKDLRVCVPGMKLVMLSGEPKIPESVSKCVDAADQGIQQSRRFVHDYSGSFAGMHAQTSSSTPNRPFCHQIMTVCL